MRLLICAGGTGGGVYPALAVLQALIEGEGKRLKVSGEMRGKETTLHPIKILWVGGIGGMEADLVKRENLLYEAIPAAGVHGVGLRALPGNLAQLARGWFAARRILGEFRPDVMFFTGGFVAVPMAFAGHLPGLGQRRPANLLYVPDIEPGLALKTLAWFANHIAVTVEESRSFFKKKERIRVTGYPTRRDLQIWSLEAARKEFGLSASLPTLLVFGGSKGARSINRAILTMLPDLLADMQVLHISGNPDWPEVDARREQLSPEQAGRYFSFPYLHSEMGAALRAADLVLSRAGASVLGEFPLFGLPAILVPYPYAWHYQKLNAQYLVDRGAAVMLADEQLPGQLLKVIRNLMQDQSRREAMRQAMYSLARPEAAESIAAMMLGMVAAPERGRE